MPKDQRPRDASNETADDTRGDNGLTPASDGADGIYQMLVEHSLAGATVIQDGRYVYVNPAMAAMLGYSRQELLAVPPGDTAYEEDRALVERNIARRETGQAGALRYTFRARRKDGQVVHLELHGASAEFQDRRVALGAVLDITEQKRLERALQDSEAEMRIARDEALSAARAKSTFLATMSHEIRTPMNAIIGMTDLLLDTPLSDTQRDFAETVRTAGEALLGVINDVLDYSKIEAGKFAIETIDFDVRSTIEEVVGMLAERAHQKDLELTALIDPALPVIVAGDPARLRQVLLNLVGNAIKFTSTGEVIVRAVVERETDDVAVVRFAVEDTGIGIALDALPRLFQPFSQVDSSTTRRFGGTGLGLAISKQLVELMGGRVGVDSVEGEGSTFWFTLTLKSRPTPAALSTIDRTALRGLRVLVLDDNLTNRTLLHQQLMPYGVRVDLVDNGAEALTRLRTTGLEGDPYALVLSDLMMPGMDGFDFARHVKADPSISDCPLVLLTSTSQRGQAAEAEQAGFAGFLVKPVREAQLLACVQSVLAPEPAATKVRAIVTNRQLTEAAAQARTRVLLAEDNPVNQKVAVLMLERLGCRVDVVGDGSQAVAALARTKFDIVFMDCLMPTLDGFEATAEIRRAERSGERVPIVAMTASAMEGDRERCLAAGMDDYVAKPVRRDRLDEVLRRWAPRQPERRSA